MLKKSMTFLAAKLPLGRAAFRAGLALTFALAATSAQANIVTCSFAKVTAVGMGSAESTREFLGEVIYFDTAKNNVQVEWEKGKSNWITPEEILKNNRFTTFIIYEDIEFSDGELTVKTLFRLFNDRTKAEVRTEPQKNAGPSREWNQNAARYACS
ncbi:hypothetical protein [Tateyamaria sp.]|uniref:hypothetical protein n=1 Tax=Tateyamaria sp. TaxID=1929288 RepID=UPI00329C54D4